MTNQNPVALVTGASRGIGRSIAVMLSKQGFRLLLVSRGQTGLEETARRCPDLGPEGIVLLATDLTQPEAPRRIIQHARATFGRLDLLVNNAGAVVSGPIGSYTLEQWEELMALNARAPFFLMQEALPLLRAAPRGCIVNIGSVVSKAGYADQSLYSASKHALLGMTKAAARDLAADRIRVHAVLPGGVNTAMVGDVRPDIDASELISPDEVAETVRFLLSMDGNAVIDELVIRRAAKPAWPV
ncbi:MAG: SDR family oxidoreductase [Spirochaetaceae bacterium]|nr:MAG: SDR family oxidoreductase [Spirochaetaceae bacterium]